MNAQGPPPPPGGPGGLPFNPQQIQQMIAMEAQKRGMTIQQFQEMQRKQVEEAAAAEGLTLEAFVAKKQEEMRQNAMRAQQQAAAQQAQGQPPGAGPGGPPPPQQGPPGQPGGQVTQIPIHNPPPPKPEALAVAKFLRNQNLKCRTCIFEGQRKDMFKVKRALRALHSPAYEKARAKEPLLPPVENDEQARNTLQLLPLSVLALRVVKKDPHEGHDHPKTKEKRVKGLWTVQIHGHQEFDPMMHYMWLYEGSQWKTKIWSVLALIAVFTVVLFPLWPLFMRQGVWYLSVGAMGLLGVFFAMAIFRLILFCVTVLAVPPGLWLFPNLFEDVGFVDSFIPTWGWQETKESRQLAKDAKKAKRAEKAAQAGGVGVGPGTGSKEAPAQVIPESNGAAVSTASEPVTAEATVPTKRHAAPTVEEADDD